MKNEGTIAHNNQQIIKELLDMGCELNEGKGSSASGRIIMDLGFNFQNLSFLIPCGRINQEPLKALFRIEKQENAKFIMKNIDKFEKENEVYFIKCSDLKNVL